MAHKRDQHTDTQTDRQTDRPIMLLLVQHWAAIIIISLPIRISNLCAITVVAVVVIDIIITTIMVIIKREFYM